jgi:hypothetical protein
VKSIMQLGETLKAGDHSRAKEALAKHLGKLVLTPVQRDGRPVYKVSGSVSVQADTEKCRMLGVAVPGHHIFSSLQLQTPPPGFCSNSLNGLIPPGRCGQGGFSRSTASMEGSEEFPVPLSCRSGRHADRA